MKSNPPRGLRRLWWHPPLPSKSEPRARARWWAHWLAVGPAAALAVWYGNLWEVPFLAIVLGGAVLMWILFHTAYAVLGAIAVLRGTGVGARRMLPDYPEEVREPEPERVKM